MLTKIDWLSFTLPIDLPEDALQVELPRLIGDALGERCNDPLRLLGMDAEFVPMKGRKPYAFGWQWPTSGVTVYASTRLGHFLVEISGRGCDRLEDKGWLYTALECFSDRLTRLDVACDMLTDVHPTEFALKRNLKAFKTFSEFHSKDGDTYYVGSMHSDRYARVYRYNPPHERAHLLRVEMVLRKEQARLASQSILKDGLDHYATALGNTYGWSHDAWKPGSPFDKKAAAWRPERRQGNTLFWLNSTVASSLISLHRQGVIDVVQWFDDNILKRLGDRGAQ